MATNFTLTRKKGGKLVTGRHDPKPCPTCYEPMRLTQIKPDKYACTKHGEPTRA